jgi:hypothetical protein
MARKVIFHVYTIQVQTFMRVIIVEHQISNLFLAITWQGQITFNERKIILYSHFVVDPQAELDLYSTNFLLGCFFNPPPKFFSQKTFFFIAELSQRVMLCIQCLWTFTFNFSVKPQLIGDKLDRNCHFNKKKILIGNPIANRVFPYIF